MADIRASGRYDAPEDRVSIGSMVQMAGAAASVALLVGIGVWGYKMVMRDVSGVPIVRAMEGKMRDRPNDPGGQAAANQGLAVNRVAAVGVAERPADRLLLAPEPMQLGEEDRPIPVIAQEKTVKAVAAALAEADIPALAAAHPSDAPLAADNVEDLAAQLSDGVEPLSQVAEPRTVSATSVAGTMVHSLRPVMRPPELAAMVTRAAQMVAAPEPVKPAAEIDAETLPAGTRLAQLGAYESEEIAIREWDRLSVRFSDYLAGKQRVIQRASSGGRVFYRLRAMGFTDQNDTRRFCSALVAERADCIPVTVK